MQTIKQIASYRIQRHTPKETIRVKKVIKPLAIHETSKETKRKLPETAPPNPVLANILHIRRLRQEFVHLVAHVEFLVQLEVAACQLLFDSREHLQGTGVLEFPRFVGNALLSIEDAAFENRRPTVPGVCVGLAPMVHAEVGDYRLATFGGERHLVWGFTNSETPVDQGVMNEL